MIGPWKRKCLVDFGIITQCIAPTRINDQYLTNLLLKINAKMGGINSLLSFECSNSVPLVSKTPTIIFGMDVSHGSPGRLDVPSIAAVVSTRKWPLISQYRASVRAQSARVEMIDGLFKPVSHNKDEGMIREMLIDFYASTTRQLKPQHIIIFRDGVSESQFHQVLNIELEQIMQGCKYLDNNWDPKFMVIVAQKTHHTKFFQPNLDVNVPPGTIIDNRFCHPKNNDFYLCAQNGPIGTTRPTHYHVLLDQIGFTTDDLQELVHSLSYVVSEKEGRRLELLGTSPEKVVDVTDNTDMKEKINVTNGSENDSAVSSSGSCSANGHKPYDMHYRTGHDSDAESTCQSGYYGPACQSRYHESACQSPYHEDTEIYHEDTDQPDTNERSADEIHRQELKAYSSTLEALYASGPLTREKETMVTDLRLSLHISNDEHLIMVKNLISASSSCRNR